MTPEELEQLEILLAKARSLIRSQHPDDVALQHQTLDIYVFNGELVGRVAHINNGSANVYRQEKGFLCEVETYY